MGAYLSGTLDILGVAADEGGLLLLVGRHCVCDLIWWWEIGCFVLVGLESMVV